MDLWDAVAFALCRRTDGRMERLDFELPQAAFSAGRCVLCEYPSRRASRREPVCVDCRMDGRGYQITDQTPLVVDVDTYPVLRNHNVYSDYPLGRGLKFYCRTCYLSDDDFTTLLLLDGVYSRAPFLSLANQVRHRLKTYRIIRSNMTGLESYLVGLLHFPVILQLRQTCRETVKGVSYLALKEFCKELPASLRL